MNAARRFFLASGVLFLTGAAFLVEFFFPTSPVSEVIRLVDGGYLASSLRLSVPIAFAALGGIFAEKSGVINIGLEGLLIASAFSGVAVSTWLSGGAVGTGAVLVVVLVLGLLLVLAALGLLGTYLPAIGYRIAAGLAVTVVLLVATVALTGTTQSAAWLSFYVAVLVSTALSLLFAVVTIEYRADQIIAGLAVWLIALGAAPFASSVIWGAVNSPRVQTLDSWAVPVLSSIQGIGPVLFDAGPTVFMLLVATPLSWYVLRRTSFGYWVRASGENPKALDTAGIDVRRVRYAAVLLSGALSGIGGASLSLDQVGEFIGGGSTMVAGRGWIGITAYLFGNYNPFGAFGASLLFASLDALQFRLQQLGYGLPPSLVQTIPYLTVIVVLALVGQTRLPDAAGEQYDSGDD